MAVFKEGKVTEIDEGGADLVRLQVAIGDDEVEAVGYPSMLGPLNAGDRVIVNTTGIELGLGTGGVAFVLWNLDGPGPSEPGEGHIVKLRYTPWQTNVLAAEAPESPHHDKLRERISIDGTPVVAFSLHSQLAAAAAGVKALRPKARVGYLMTDGAALALAWSELVSELKEAGLVDVTATCGHAFGGDLEAVNIFSGLTALVEAGGAEVIIAGMGPGAVGTGTVLGHTAIEQGQILDATAALQGRAFACLRISFADRRPRQRGVSHHSLTALSVVARERCKVVIPHLPPEQASQVIDALESRGIVERHEIMHLDGGPGLRLLESKGIRPSSMGHAFEDVPEFFLAASAAGRAAAEVSASFPYE